MTVYLTSVQRPNATSQTGLVTNTVTGAASMDAALSDSSDSSYVTIDARARLDTQVARVATADPVLASTSRVFSVGVRARIQSLVTGSNPVTLLLWLRTVSGAVTVAGQSPDVRKVLFTVPCPTDATGGVWTDVDLGELTYAPDGTPWDATPTTGNLANLYCDLGRDDDDAADLKVSALYFDVNYQQIATVTVTAPTTPSSDTQFTVKWTYASANFAPQQGYRVAVYTQAQTLAGGFVPFVTQAQYVSGLVGATADTSWWQLGEDQQWVVPGDLTDGTYVAYVQATSQWAGTGGDFVTAISSITWVRAAAPASPPATAVFDSAAYSYANKRVDLTFHPGGSSPATVAFTVQKSLDGVNWAAASPSLTYVEANGMTPVTRSDRFVLLNVPQQYRIVAYSGSPLVAAAAPSTPITVTPIDDRNLLHHPTNDLLDTDIEIKAPKGDEGIPVTLPEMQATFYYTGGPQNEVLPGMTWGPTYGRQIALKLWFDMIGRPGLWAAVEALRKARCPLFYQMPTGDAFWIGMGPGQTGQDTKDAVNFVPGVASKYQWKRREVVFTEINPPSYF